MLDLPLKNKSNTKFKKMKKIVSVCIAVLLFAVTSLNARVNTSVGLKIQANYSKYRISGMGDADSKYGAGAGIGGFAKIEFGEHFALQPELLLNFTDSKIKNNGSTKYCYVGLEIPLYAVGQINAGNGKLFLGAGPYAAYGITNKAKNGSSVNLYKKQNGQNKAMMDRFDFGVGGILGYEFEGGFIVNAGYRMGLKDNLKSGWAGSMKTSAFSLGVGYKF